MDYNKMQVLPRRQSCDRCHNGKVRCIREETNSGALRDCTRCRRAGIVPCVYSVQKTPGRQPINRRSAGTSALETPRPTTYDFDPSVELGLVPITFSSSANKDMSTIMEVGLDANKLSMFQPIEAYIEQLVQLSLRILRSERAVFASTMPLSIASPCFNDIYEATSCLINLINQYADVHATPLRSFDPKPFDPSNFDTIDTNFFFNMADASMADASMTDYSSSNAPMAVAPDPGVVLLILACHQRLLSVFERICLSLSQDLQDIQLGTLERFSQRHDLPSVSQSSTISLTGQFVMAIQLVNHLLGRLDRALSPLSENDMQPLGILTTFSSGGSSSSGNSSDTSEKLEFSGEDQSDRHGKGNSRSRQEQSHGYSVGTKVLETMHRRHGQLRDHIKAIKRTINLSNDI